jgi:hypothetical protein
MAGSEEDRELLTLAAEAASSDSAKTAFEDMLQKLDRYPLSVEQRAWARATINGEKYEPPIEYKNEWSAGLIPRGREVATAPVLRVLPKKPPGRK